MSVTSAATLPVREQTVHHLARLRHAERRRRGTRTGTRALDCFAQAILVLRWFIDGTRMRQLARDHGIAGCTCYDYVHEGSTYSPHRPRAYPRHCWPPRPPATAT